MDVSQKIEAKHPKVELEFRFALVAYKDYGDADRINTLPFTGSIGEFRDFLQRVVASGGGDCPEDVLGALKNVTDLDDWQSMVRFCILVCDAPGHGRDLNDCGDDGYEMVLVVYIK